MMYEKIVRAMNMKQVALEVLSYHVSSSQEEVDRLAVIIQTLFILIQSQAIEFSFNQLEE
jgi:hypothetical protein